MNEQIKKYDWVRKLNADFSSAGCAVVESIDSHGGIWAWHESKPILWDRGPLIRISNEPACV